MSRQSHWLLLAHAFNMDGRAASQTVTDKIPYLLDSGIDLTVFSAVTGEQDDRFKHRQLLPWGPSGLRFDLRHMVAKRYGRGLLYRLITLIASLLLLPFIIVERLLFGLSHHSSWSLPAAFYGIRLVRQGKVDLIYSSGGAWSAHLAAARIKAKTGVTWIAEVHDPLLNRERPLPGRNGKMQLHVERRICREADHVWWFTPGAVDCARQRVPELGNRGFHLLPGARDPGLTSDHSYTDTLNLAHFGTIANDRSLAPLIAALGRLKNSDPELARHVKIHSWGCPLDDRSATATRSAGLTQQVIVHDRLDRATALAHMYQSDILLLIHGYEGCEECIPSKLFEYFWTRRPVFGLTIRNAFLDDLLRLHGSYVADTFDETAVEETLKEIILDWKKNKLRQPVGEPIDVGSAVETILARLDQAALTTGSGLFK